MADTKFVTEYTGKYKAKYFDGQSARSQAATIQISNGQLLILCQHSLATLDSWSIADLQFDPRMPHIPILMSIHEPDGRLELMDLKFLKELESLKPQLKKNFQSKKQLAWLVVIFALVLLTLLAGVSPLSNILAKKIPFSLEKEFAAKLKLEQHFPSCKLTTGQSQALEKLVASVYPVFATDTAFTIQVRVADDPAINAFAFLGGEVILNRGLLKAAQTPEEVAGVLAHEIGHVEHRHVLQGLIQGTFFTSLLNFVSGNVSQVVLIDPVTAGNLIALKFSRTLELEADQAGIARLTKQQIDLQGYYDFFKRDTSALPGALTFISNHPGNSERMELIKKTQQQTPLARKVLLDDIWQELKSACQPVSSP